MGWLLAAILVPLWINLWGSQPFDPAKINLLRLSVWFLAAVWLADWLQWPRSYRFELPPPSLLLSLIALALAASLSTWAAAEPGLALWGSQQRANGLLTLLTYLLLGVLVAARRRSFVQARLLATFMVATAAPLVFLGGLQAVGHDPLGFITDARSPVYTTLGRANFTGAYLALLLPLTLALAGMSGRRLRAALLLLAGGQLLLIGLTMARAAWLAAVVGLLLLFIGWAWPRLSRRAWYGLGGFVGLPLVVGGLWAGQAFLLAEDGSIAARRVIWRESLTLIGERPLLGHGLDNLAIQFARVFPPELVYYQGRDVFVDRAHNWLLDTAVTTGLLGLAAAVWVWGAVFWYGWRTLRRFQENGDWEKGLLLMGCLAALGANLAGNLFSFDVAATAVASWLLWGLIISLGRPEGEPDWPLHPSRLRLGVAGMLLVASVWAGWQGGGRFLVADAAHQLSLDRAAQGNWAAAAEAAGQAVARWPQEPAHWQQLAQAQAAGGAFDGAAVSWQQAVTLRPTDPAIWAAQAHFYLELAEQGQMQLLPLAELAAVEAVALAPNIARLYVLRGRIHLLDGRSSEAAQQFAQAVDLDATDSLAWALLADVYTSLGEFAQADAAWQEAERWR
jgi:O-antigen ligase/cytochrome c-type biogenesis protein CcmH/NrfG